MKLLRGQVNALVKKYKKTVVTKKNGCSEKSIVMVQAHTETLFGNTKGE